MIEFIKNLFRLIFPIVAQTFPSVPFEVNIRVGANVYSPTGSTLWGTIKDNSIYTTGTVSAIFGDKVRILFPLWTNGKDWSVKQTDVTVIINEPDPTMPQLVHVVETYENGTVILYDNAGNVLWP
jgi:hypothetical protein